MYKFSVSILKDSSRPSFVLRNACELKIYIAILPLLLIVLASLSHASEIVIVSSNEAAPYIKAQNALEKHLAGEGYTTQAIMLTELRNKMDSVMSDDTKALVAVGSPATIWLHKRVSPPVLLTYCMVANPAGAALDKDPPVLGISTDVPIKSQFKLISEALPRARCVGMLYRSKTEKGKFFLKRVKANLPKGWILEAVAIDKHNTVAEAIRELFKRDIDIVWTFPDSSIYNRATVRTLLLASIRKKVPVFGYSPAFVKAGSLLGIAINPETQGKQAATLTHQLLCRQGKAPGESDVNSKKELRREAVKFEIALNLIVAEQLSIDLPESLEKRAKHIFRPESSKQKERQQ